MAVIKGMFKHFIVFPSFFLHMLDKNRIYMKTYAFTLQQKRRKIKKINYHIFLYFNVDYYCNFHRPVWNVNFLISEIHFLTKFVNLGCNFYIIVLLYKYELAFLSFWTSDLILKVQGLIHYFLFRNGRCRENKTQYVWNMHEEI